MKPQQKAETIQEKNEEYFCYDCSKKLNVSGEEIEGGKLLKYQDEETKEEFYIVKCDECFKNNQALTSFRDCEVYSRIVGYMRPVQQWNVGKRLEFERRKNYKV
jgi:Zn finger protein HypA/HybF involved in hydrogenase expression